MEEDPKTDPVEASAAEVDEFEENPEDVATAPHEDGLDQVTPGDIQIQAAPPLSEAELDASTSKRISDLIVTLTAFSVSPRQLEEQGQESIAFRAIRTAKVLAARPNNHVKFENLAHLVGLADKVDRILTVQHAGQALPRQIHELLKLAKEIEDDLPAGSMQALREALRLCSPQAELELVTERILHLLNATNEIDPNNPESIEKLRKTLIEFANNFMQLRTAILQNNLQGIKAEARQNALRDAMDETNALIAQLETNGTTVLFQHELAAVESLRQEVILLRTARKPAASPSNQFSKLGVCLALGLSVYNFVDGQKPTLVATASSYSETSEWIQIKPYQFSDALRTGDENTVLRLLQSNVDPYATAFLVANCPAEKVLALAPVENPSGFGSDSLRVDGYAPLDKTPREICENARDKMFAVVLLEN